MTQEQFQRYLDEVNDRAEPFVPLVSCFGCAKPIEDECVIFTEFDPPRWYHLECDPAGDDLFVPGAWIAKRKDDGDGEG